MASSIRLDWRVEDAGGLKIADLIVEGVSLRTTYRSDVASVIQNNGGKVAGLIDALRQKTGDAVASQAADAGGESRTNLRLCPSSAADQDQRVCASSAAC